MPTTRRDATTVLPPFPSHLLGNAVSPSLPRISGFLSTLGLPLAAAGISPIACSSSDSYICPDDDPNDEFDLIVHKVLETIVEAVGTMIAFFVVGSVFFRHLNEFVSRPALSSATYVLCGIWEVCIAVRAAYLVDQNAKMRMNCHPKIADDGHVDTVLLFILKMLLLFYSSSCLLKAGSPPCLVLVLIVLQYLILNQVSP